MAEDKPIIIYGNFADPLIALYKSDSKIADSKDPAIHIAKNTQLMQSIEKRVDRLLTLLSQDVSGGDTSNASIEVAGRNVAKDFLNSFKEDIRYHDPDVIRKVLKDLQPSLDIARQYIAGKESAIDWHNEEVLTPIILQIGAEAGEGTMVGIFGKEYSDSNEAITYRNLIKLAAAEATVYHNVPNANGAPLLTLGKPVAAVETPPVLHPDLRAAVDQAMAESRANPELNPAISGSASAKELLPVNGR